MSYILVTADFPGVSADQRKKIYSLLAEKLWNKIHEPGRDIDTVWQASFQEGVSEENSIKETKSDFDNCSKPYCKPKLVIHWGPSKPTRHGLV